MHNIILSHTISNYTINHIKSSNILKWLTVIQTPKRKRKKKYHKKKYQQTERVKERNKKIVRVKEKMKILEKRKKEKQNKKIHQKYVFRGDTKYENK